MKTFTITPLLGASLRSSLRLSGHSLDDVISHYEPDRAIFTVKQSNSKKTRRVASSRIYTN